MPDPELRAYRSTQSMEPIALLDYYVKVITYNEPRGFFRRVNYLERIPPFQCLDMGALAAQTLGVKTAAPNLDLWDEEFGQWRFFPLDDGQYSLFIPSGVSKWQLKNMTVTVDKSILTRDPELGSTEFCTWEDQRPSFQCGNFTDYALMATRIMTFGYRFHVAEPDETTKQRLNSGALPYTPILCAGMGGAGR